MVEQLSGTPLWFILFVVFIMSGVIVFLGSYFLWSLRRVFLELEQSINSLKDLIHSLYDKHSAHESRISVMEGILLHRRKTDEED